MRNRLSTDPMAAVHVVAALTMLLVTTPGLRAADQSDTSRSASRSLHTVKIVDVLNLFPNVGALVFLVGPNDAGFPLGIATHCTGTLIHERAFLVAGHCTAATGGTLLPFVQAFVTFSPNALDRSAWLEIADLKFHPSIPPCPPPDFCTFRGLDKGILDVGLVFLREPVRHIEPARLAKPGTLERARAAGKPLMIVPGYGHLNSLPGGVPPPDSEWDGLRRIKISRLERVADNEWASWSLPGIVCYGDSGAPTFFNDRPLAGRSHERVVALGSDGGDVCYTRDDRARVDTSAAQDWIRETIAEVLGRQR